MTAHLMHSPSGQASARRAREYDQPGAAPELRSAGQPARTTTVGSLHVALQEALREIALIEQHLQALADVATLRRFGEPEAGVSIAESLGHVLLTTGKARTVDRLSRMPGGITLVRAYLELSGVPHLSELRRNRDDC